MEKRLVNHSTKSQCAQILKWLKRGRRLNGLEALSYFGCLRLPSRINDLKREGYVIKRSMERTLVTNKHIAVYYMGKA